MDVNKGVVVFLHDLFIGAAEPAVRCWVSGLALKLLLDLVQEILIVLARGYFLEGECKH